MTNDDRNLLFLQLTPALSGVPRHCSRVAGVVPGTVAVRWGVVPGTVVVRRGSCRVPTRRTGALAGSGPRWASHQDILSSAV